MKNKKLIYDLDSKDIPSNIGGKAQGLKWLYDNGFNIPYTCVSVAFDSTEFEKQAESLVSEVLIKNKFEGSKIAVRSSGITEDGENESKAGNYKTELSVDFSRNSIREAVKKVVESGSDCGEQMGIVFQTMINAEISGVISTSNPTTYSKKECIVNFRHGLGDKLVSGQDDGEERIIEKDKINEIQEAWLNELCKYGMLAEKKLGRPQNIEFSVEKGSGKLFFLQCRPDTGFHFFKENTIKQVSSSELVEYNQIDSSKVSMRLKAEKRGVKVSPAFVVNVNCFTDEFPIKEIDLKKSEFYISYSVVVIQPKLTDSKIIRAFAGDKKNATKCISCNRYGIRALPKHDNVLETLKEFYKKVCENSWICTMIIQEIFDPLYTGILKRNGDNFLLEVIYGHFIAKGNIPSSSYIIDQNGKIINRNEIEQLRTVQIIEGFITEQELKKKICLSDDEISTITKTFSGYLTNEGYSIIEIGILKKDEKIIPYLIDITENTNNDNIPECDFLKGVISSGKGQGILVKIESQDIESSINSHFMDSAKVIDNNRKEIYLCDTPNIDLKNRLGENCAGFLFKEGSMLCHLSVLLREKGIPAIVGVDENLLEEGKLYEIDTNINGNWENKVREK